MNEPEKIYDPALADGRFQLEMLGVRWALVVLYALFAGIGVIQVDIAWFIASGGFLFAFHVSYTWYVWCVLCPTLEAASMAMYSLGNYSCLIHFSIVDEKKYRYISSIRVFL